MFLSRIKNYIKSKKTKKERFNYVSCISENDEIKLKTYEISCKINGYLPNYDLSIKEMTEQVKSDRSWFRSYQVFK